MSTNQNQPLIDLEAIHLDDLADLIGADYRTINTHFKKFNVKVANKRVSIVDIYNAIKEFNEENNDGRKKKSLNIEQFKQAESESTGLEPFGQLNIAASQEYKAIMEGAKTAFSVGLLRGDYVLKTEVSRIMFGFTNELNAYMESITTRIREENKYATEVIDACDGYIQEARTLIFDHCSDFVDQLEPIEGETVFAVKDHRTFTIRLYALLNKRDIADIVLLVNNEDNRELIQIIKNNLEEEKALLGDLDEFE